MDGRNLRDTDRKTASKPYVTNENQAGLPPLRSVRKPVWDYYRIKFLPDGYPGKSTGENIAAHPIYGPYVIADYIHQYRTSRNTELLEAAIKVANAAASRMTPIGDGLAFMYDHDLSRVSSKPGTWYSALTQARYLDSFSRLMNLTADDRFQELGERVLASLAIPISEGGVAHSVSNGGLLLEEYPSPMIDCTLNGWATATLLLHSYAEAQRSALGYSLYEQSVQGIEGMVALYDMPTLATSRYKLKGRAPIFVKSLNTRISLESVHVDVPTIGHFDANRSVSPAGFALPHAPLLIDAGVESKITINLTRASFPEQNRIEFEVFADEAGVVEVAIGDCKYNPLVSAVSTEWKNRLGTYRVPRGLSMISVPVSWSEADMIAYPTNFGKRIAGRQYNQYHRIHVSTLSKLLKLKNGETLEYYRDQWERYMQDWESMPEYQDARLTLSEYRPTSR